MAITYHAGRRIQGLATDRTAVTPTIDTTSSAGNTIITFTGDGTFAPKSVFDVEYLVVGGGGSGAVNSGGGGAGGYRTATGFEVTVQNYTINVGEGGIGSGYTGDRGNNGSDSVFSTITSTGGGGGGCELSGQIIGGNGGSGGGGGHTSGSAGGISSPVTSPVQGYAGGSSGNTQVGGGGGGSSVVGSNGSGTTAGNGGNGTANSITGSSVTYSAGGGGGDVSSGSTGGSSGIGGDGSGQNGTGTAGDTNTGSGGGGSTGGSGNSGNGGSGIVIIRYINDGIITATGGTVTTTTPVESTVHSFQSSGTFTVTGAGDVDMLVVAGGGSGGMLVGTQTFRGAGGGAGGVIHIPQYPVVAASYTVTIGSGGDSAGGTARNAGVNTSFSGNSRTLTGNGGGYGAQYDNTNNTGSGGSGGGSWYIGYAGGASTQSDNTSDGVTTYNDTGYGNNGGTSGNSQPYSSGGGGAGAAGGDYDSGLAGVGGKGLDLSSTHILHGEDGWFGGGGGSGSYVTDEGYVEPFGGKGGGGLGSNDVHDIKANGINGTGGGGGSGGSGGSGVVIIRYPTSSGVVATGGVITTEYDEGFVKPELVQNGSRFEETDTRNMYHKDDVSWKEENDGNIENIRSASLFEQFTGETP